MNPSGMAEHRSVELRDAELDGYEFRGYAAVFDAPWDDRLTEQLGYVEKVARGAFRKALRDGSDIPLLWHHDRQQLLATTKSGNLRLAEDGNGLVVEATLPQTTLGAYAREMIERRDVQGMSYGMQTAREDSIISKQNGVTYRTIANVRRLLDVTLTWEPAYSATSIELRSAGFVALTLQEIDEGQGEQLVEAATREPPGGQSRRVREIVLQEMTREGYR